MKLSIESVDHGDSCLAERCEQAEGSERLSGNDLLHVRGLYRSNNSLFSIFSNRMQLLDCCKVAVPVSSATDASTLHFFDGKANVQGSRSAIMGDDHSVTLSLAYHNLAEAKRSRRTECSNMPHAFDL